MVALVCAALPLAMACSGDDSAVADPGAPATPPTAVASTAHTPGPASGRRTCRWPAAVPATRHCDGRPALPPPAPTETQHSGKVTTHWNLPYGKDAPPFQVGDLYVPAPEGAPSGVVVVVHGGGWDDCNRRRQATAWYARHLADREGVAAFNIEYRLVAEGGRYPHNLRDVRCATQWIAAHAADYGVDGSRIALVGESAGGHLSLLLALTQDRADLDPKCGADPALAGVVAYSAPTDLSALAEESSLGKALVGGYVGPCPSPPATCDPSGHGCGSCVDASPLSHVCRARRARPPLVLVHAQDPLDPLLSDAHPRRLALALADRAWPHQLVIIDADALRAVGCDDGPAPHGLLAGSPCMIGPSEAAVRDLLGPLRPP